MALELPHLLGRSVTIDTSKDFGLTDPWSPWLVPGNDGIPRSLNVTNILSAPATDSKRFFRIKLQEE